MKRAIGGVEEAKWTSYEWATSPWGQHVPDPYRLVSDMGGSDGGIALPDRPRHLCAIFRQTRAVRSSGSPLIAARMPERVPRHSLAARMFHWVMAAAMFTLLFTAFLPKVGIQFDWVTYHWIAGIVLTASVLFHIIHASFWHGLLVDLAG